MAKSRRDKRKTEITINSDENRKAIAGEDNQNIERIKRATQVNIDKTATGLRVIGGEYKKHKAAATMIEQMNKLLENDVKLDDAKVAEVINLEIENAKPRSEQPPAEFSEIFNGEALTLKSKIVEPRNDAQKTYAQMIVDNYITFGIGPAGTGKTYIALAMAIAAYELRQVDKIILCRPAVEAGEKLGYLPGDAKSKVDPYFQPIYDTLDELMPGYKPLVQNKTIEIAPLAFMRGRTLKNAFVILDEAQNATPTQMRMFLSRFGEGTKMVVDGDISQIDLPEGQASGLVEALDALQQRKGMAFQHFNAADVERHPIVSNVIKDYADYDAKKKNDVPPTPKQI